LLLANARREGRGSSAASMWRRTGKRKAKNKDTRVGLEGAEGKSRGAIRQWSYGEKEKKKKKKKKKKTGWGAAGRPWCPLGIKTQKRLRTREKHKNIGIIASAAFQKLGINRGKGCMLRSRPWDCKLTCVVGGGSFSIISRPEDTRRSFVRGQGIDDIGQEKSKKTIGGRKE